MTNDVQIERAGTSLPSIFTARSEDAEEWAVEIPQPCSAVLTATLFNESDDSYYKLNEADEDQNICFHVHLRLYLAKVGKAVLFPPSEVCLGAIGTSLQLQGSDYLRSRRRAISATINCAVPMRIPTRVIGTVLSIKRWEVGILKTTEEAA